MSAINPQCKIIHIYKTSPKLQKPFVVKNIFIDVINGVVVSLIYYADDRYYKFCSHENIMG